MIRDIVLPAFPEDADPFVSERADDGVERMAFGLAVAHERLGPDGVFPRLLGPLDEGLSGVIITAQTTVNFVHFAAFLGDRRDADPNSHRLRLLTAARLPPH